MKRVLTVILAALLAVALAQTRLTVWTHFGDAELAYLEAQAERFEAETGVQITIVEIPFGDILQNFMLGAPEGDSADLVVTIPHDWVGELAAAGVLEPMDAHADAALLADLQESAAEAFMFGGRLFGLPMSAEAVALIYNRELVPEPPTSWEELLELAQAQMEAGNFGFMYTYADPYFNAGWFHAYGARVFGQAEDGGLDPSVILLGGEPGYQAGRFIQSLRWTHNLIPEGTDYEVANSAFIQGVLAMIINGPWALGDYRTAGIDFGIAPVPAPPEAPEPWQPFIGVQGVVVNAFAPAARKEAAIAFAKQLASPESLLAFNRAAGRIPVSEAALAELGDDVVVQGFSEVIAVGIPMPNIPEMGRVWAPWGNAIELVGQSPTADVEAIIDDMVEQIVR